MYCKGQCSLLGRCGLTKTYPFPRRREVRSKKKEALADIMWVGECTV